MIVTVRSDEKATKLREALCIPHLDYRIVKDIAQPDAFDEVLKIDGVEYVIHTASPFLLDIKDIKKDLLDPAIIGTTGILSAIKKNAPSVRKVIITSSTAAIIDVNKPLDEKSVACSENVWNSITMNQALENPMFGYRASKTFAERAAWEFMEREKPSFTLTTVNPCLVFGPPLLYLNPHDNLNTSNKIIYDLITGKYKTEKMVPSTTIWVDVRDVALAHIKAIELDTAADKRLLVLGGNFSNKSIVETIRSNFPEFAEKLPGPDKEIPENLPIKYDNSSTTGILGSPNYTFSSSIVDTVKKLKEVLT